MQFTESSVNSNTSQVSNPMMISLECKRNKDTVCDALHPEESKEEIEIEIWGVKPESDDSEASHTEEGIMAWMTGGTILQIPAIDTNITWLII